jgi:isopenicillin-N epimerase
MFPKHATTSYPPMPDAADWGRHWKLRSDTIYLNHGSFGPAPEPVLAAERRWKAALDEQPMDFFTRLYEPAWRAARRKLADWLGAAEDNLVFVENATQAMNVVADSFPLAAGDEVVLNDHEYGAVIRIWRRACERAGAAAPVIATLPRPFDDPAEVVDAIFAAVTPRTRLIIASHITSATALTLPVAAICRRAASAGIAVCIDGPHALAQLDLSLDTLGCDFYAASCHKWLSAPFGSGFLYVAPRRQASIRVPQLSWGRLLPDKPSAWFEEFIWSGTRNPSSYLAVPDAIDFVQSVGVETFRQRARELAEYARHCLVERFRMPPLATRFADWHVAMAHVPLPPGDARALQQALWQRHRIEVPIVDWSGGRYVRVSCHLYNTRDQVDTLVESLAKLIADEA